MIRKLVAAFVLVPLAVLIVVLAVINRQAVTLSLDPFTADKPAIAVTQPLFLIIVAALIVGVIVGGIATWLRQSKWRRTARRLEAEVRRLRAETGTAPRRGGADDLRLLAITDRPSGVRAKPRGRPCASSRPTTSPAC